MSTTFSRSLRSLERDRFTRGGRMLAGALVLLGAWCAWMLLARVGVYASSREARLEAARSSHVLQTEVGGVVIENRLALGARVAVGDPLVVLDAALSQADLARERARLQGFERQIAALRSGRGSERTGQLSSAAEVQAAITQARTRLAEAESAARFAEDEASRMATLGRSGTVATLEVERSAAEARQRRLAAVARRDELVLLEREGATDRSDRQSGIERIEREIAELEGDAAASRAAIARLDREIALRTIRAPIGGRVGEVTELRPGSVVTAAARLGSIVPDGELRMVAQFAPQTAFGRLAPGQPAQLRLAGFPWTQFGGVPARVLTVGSEVRDGLVRVELAIEPSSSRRIPLQHGLPGSVEVEVERVTPAALLARTVGLWLGDSSDAAVVAEGATR